MDKQAVAERVLTILKNQSNSFGSANNGGLALFGQPQSMQPEAVKAIDAWMRHNDKDPILGFVNLLQTMDILSEQATQTLVDQINDAS